jgi:hypothetical protein
MKSSVVKTFLTAVVLSSGIVGCWAFVALLSGLRHTGWQVQELIRQYMVATGIVTPAHTLVDFYSHIKGVEYLICLAFFVVFPLFYRYVNEDKKRVQTKG